MADCLIVGLSGGYVHNLLRTAPPEFRSISKRISESLQMDTEEEIPCIFSGLSLSRDKEGNLEQNQNLCLQKLENSLLILLYLNFAK